MADDVYRETPYGCARCRDSPLQQKLRWPVIRHSDPGTSMPAGYSLGNHLSGRRTAPTDPLSASLVTCDCSRLDRASRSRVRYGFFVVAWMNNAFSIKIIQAPNDATLVEGNDGKREWVSADGAICCVYGCSRYMGAPGVGMLSAFRMPVSLVGAEYALASTRKKQVNKTS